MNADLQKALRRLEYAVALPEGALMRQFLVNTALFEAADAYNIARGESTAPEVPEAVAQIAWLRRLPRHPSPK